MPGQPDRTDSRWSRMRRRKATPGTVGGRCPDDVRQFVTPGSTAVVAFVPRLDKSASAEIDGFEKLHRDFANLGTELVVVTGDDATKAPPTSAVRIVEDDGTIAESMQVVGPDGRPIRATFLIDNSGCVAFTFYRVNPATHAKTVLRTLRRLRSRTPTLRPVTP